MTGQCWSDSESGRETIFRTSEVRGQLGGFSWLVQTGLFRFSSRHSTQVQNCWRWILSSLSAKKETQTEIGSSSVAVRDLFCPLPIRARLQSNSFLICSLEICFVWSTPAMMPVFLRPFTNALIIYLPGQRYWKTVCCAAACEGNEQWRL